MLGVGGRILGDEVLEAKCLLCPLPGIRRRSGLRLGARLAAALAREPGEIHCRARPEVVGLLGLLGGRLVLERIDLQDPYDTAVALGAHLGAQCLGGIARDGDR